MSTALGEPAGGEELLECSRVDLRVGQAVQLRAPVRSHLTGGDGREPEVEVVRYFDPVSQWRMLLVMASSTRALFAGDAFAELFDALALSAMWRSSAAEGA